MNDEYTIPSQHEVPQTRFNVVDFPVPTPEPIFPARHKKQIMPNTSRRRKFKFGCDADRMDTHQFENIMQSVKQTARNNSCCDYDEPPRSSRPEGFGVTDPRTGELTCCLDQSCVYCASDNDPAWDRPATTEMEPLSISSVQEEIQPGNNHQECLFDLEISLKMMATKMMANFKKRDLQVPQSIRDYAELNLITPLEDNSVLNLNQKMVSVLVPCAVDSGACANVTPWGIFSLEKSAIKLDPKYFGADGSPIENLGYFVAIGTCEEGVEMKIDFDIAKVTRPLLSVHKMTSNGHKVIFNEGGGYIQVKGTNTKVNLRQEGRLFMLDLWVKVAQEIADSSPFVRQVAKA